MQDSIYVAELLQGHRQLSGFFIASGLETIIFTLPTKKNQITTHQWVLTQFWELLIKVIPSFIFVWLLDWVQN